MKPVFAALTLGLMGSCVAPESLAQGTDQGAQAQLLFDQGKASMKGGDYAAACPKFEQSLALDFQLGALLQLARCFEGLGRTASAWAKYTELVSRAQKAGDQKKEQAAAERVAALEKILSRLEVDATEVTAIAGVEARRNGEPLPPALFATAFPVDPGEQVIEVSAPGYATASVRAAVPTGAAITRVRLPALVKTPPPQPAEPVPPAPAPVAAPPPEQAAPPAASPPPATERSEDGMATQTLLGYVAAGAGVVGLGVGVGFYVKRNSKLEARDAACPAAPAAGCPSESKRIEYEARQEEAKSAATLSTVFVIAGGALAATGGVLVLTAPSSKSQAVGLRLTPVLSADGGGLWAEGTW